MRNLTTGAVVSQVPIFIALFFHAFANTLVIPMLPGFLTDELGGGAQAASEYVFASVVSGLILTMVVGRVTGRLIATKHLTLVATAWLAIGSILVASVDKYVSALLVGLIFTCAFHVPSALLFGMLKHQQTRSKRLAGIGTLRMTYILGSVLGPVVGGALLTLAVSAREVFVAQAIAYLLTFLVIAFGVRCIAVPEAAEDPSQALVNTPTAKQDMSWPVVALVMAIVLLLMGDTLRVTTLPLLLDQKFNAEPWQIGIAMSVVPFAEVPTMIMVLFVASKVGELSVLILAALAGALFFLLVPVATEVWQIYGLQALYAVLRTSVMAAGMSLLFELQPNQTDRVATLQFSAQQAAVLIGSLLAAVLVARLGLSDPYYAFLFTSLIALLGLMAVAGHQANAKHVRPKQVPDNEL